MNARRRKHDRRCNKALRLAQTGAAESVIAAAQEILATRIKHREALGSPAAVCDYLHLLLHDREHEVFVVVLLDAQHRVLFAEELFRGTLTQTSVYPREVVKLALRENAAAVIFAHNHPSGVAESWPLLSRNALSAVCGEGEQRREPRPQPNVASPKGLRPIVALMCGGG